MGGGAAEGGTEARDINSDKGRAEGQNSHAQRRVVTGKPKPMTEACVTVWSPPILSRFLPRLSRPCTYICFVLQLGHAIYYLMYD